MRNITALSLVLFQISLCAPLYCFDLGFAKEDGGQPGAFLSYGAGARSLGMGKTFTGVADDASAAYWNPAGLVQLEKREITALYASLYEKTGYSFLAYAQQAEIPGLPRSRGALGIAVVNLNSSGFQLRDEFNNEAGEGSANESALLVSYGKTVWKNLSAGVSLKAVNQNAGGKAGTGYGMDGGILYADQRGTAHGPLAPLSIGLCVQNIVAPRITLVRVTDQYPLTVVLGAGYRFCNDALLLALDVNKTEKRDYKVHFGGEYKLIDMLSIRAGIDETELTSGLGFTWLGYSLDYAFAYHDAWGAAEDLGISHRFGLTARW
ncbi:MAG: PorV/PorQ family protein [Endomicrobiales bacterium]